MDNCGHTRRPLAVHAALVLTTYVIDLTVALLVSDAGVIEEKSQSSFSTKRSVSSGVRAGVGNNANRIMSQPLRQHKLFQLTALALSIWLAAALKPEHVPLMSLTSRTMTFDSGSSGIMKSGAEENSQDDKSLGRINGSLGGDTSKEEWAAALR